MSTISITSSRIVNNHAEYAVERNGPGSLVWRRYRDFETLRKALLLDAPVKRLIPELPSKQTWWASRSSDVVNQRKVQLEAFLREVEEVCLISTDNRKAAWEAFFELNANNSNALSLDSSSASTYLDTRDSFAKMSSSEDSLSHFESSALPGIEDKSRDVSSDDIKRLEREIDSIKSASSEDLSKFIKGLETEREESRALRMRVQQLENEVAKIRTSPTLVENEEADRQESHNVTKGRRLNRNEDSSASIPSLESEIDAQPYSEFTQDTMTTLDQRQYPSLELTSSSLEGLKILARGRRSTASANGMEMEAPSAAAFSPIKEEEIADDVISEANASPPHRTAVGGVFGALLSTRPYGSSSNLATAANELAVSAQSQGNEAGRNLNQSIAISIDGMSMVAPVDENTTGLDPSANSSTMLSPEAEMLQPSTPGIVNLNGTTLTPEDHLGEESDFSSNFHNETTVLQQPNDENNGTNDFVEEKDEIFRGSSNMNARRFLYDHTEASFLAHVDDEPTPSILDPHQEEGNDVSDLSAISMVEDVEDEDTGDFESTLHKSNVEDEVSALPAIPNVPTMNGNRASSLKSQKRPPPMPPLPPNGTRTSESQQEKRPPVNSHFSSKTTPSSIPARMAKRSSPQQRTKTDMSTPGAQQRSRLSTVSFQAQHETSSILGDDMSMEAVIEAMRSQAHENETVARFGCKTMLNLAGESKEAREKLGRLGACEVCLVGLASHPSHEKVVVEACGAICNLALDEWNAKELRRLGAFRLLSQALDRFGSMNQGLAFAGISACLNLIADKESAKRFGRSGGARSSLSCLLAWGEINPDIALEGCVAVRNLGEDLSMARELGRLGACDAVAKCMIQFGLQRKENALEGLIAMRNLSIDEVNRMVMFRTNGSFLARIIVRCMDVYGAEDAIFFTHACLTIRNLTSKNEHNARVLSNAGLCECLTQIGMVWLKKSQEAPNDENVLDVEDVAYGVCAAVWNLSFDLSAARNMLKHSSVSKFLPEALRICGGKSSKVSLIACGAIFRLVATCGSVARKDLTRNGIMDALRSTCPNENLHAAIDCLDS